MFGSKSTIPLTKKGLKKMDALVTGMILGGIVASIYGIQKSEISKEAIKQKILTESDKHSLGSIIRMLVFGTTTLSQTPVEKPTLSSKIRSKLQSFFVWK
jgi:hypothetical protein